MVLYSVYDKVSGVFSPLSCGLNEEVVKRNLRLGIQADPNMTKCIDDYFLHFFGRFDERSGDIITDVALNVVPFKDLLEV